MEALFNLCEGWETCGNKELKDLFEERMIQGKNFKWPTEQKMRELNKICASCSHCLELDSEDCPVCGGIVMTTPPFPLPFEFEVPSSVLYFYKCANCKKHLYSFEKIG